MVNFFLLVGSGCAVLVETKISLATTYRSYWLLVAWSMHTIGLSKSWIYLLQFVVIERPTHALANSGLSKAQTEEY